jgi:hypothetical protein
MRNSPVQEQEPRFLWERQDLIAFVGFFVLTLFLPVLLLIMFRLIQPGANVEGLTAVQQIFLEALVLACRLYSVPGRCRSRQTKCTLRLV